MSILDSLMSAGGSGIVNQLASQFGISGEQATSAASTLLPALAGGFKEHLAAGDSSGLSNLINSGALSKFANDPSSLASPAALEQGKSLLSSLFGSGDLTNMVSMVADKVGISGSTVTSMLPIAATALGGLLSKSAATGGDVSGILGQLADVGHSGILGAVKSLAAKMFG